MSLLPLQLVHADDGRLLATAKSTVTVFAGPGTSEVKLGTLRAGGKLYISGRDASGDWLYFLYYSKPAWVTAEALQVVFMDKKVWNWTKNSGTGNKKVQNSIHTQSEKTAISCGKWQIEFQSFLPLGYEVEAGKTMVVPMFFVAKPEEADGFEPITSLFSSEHYCP